jgi:hypothetical protein
MKARRLIDRAAYGPKTVKAMGEAFDLAWVEIAEHYTAPTEIEAARIKLAQVMLLVAAEGSVDVEALKDKAVQAMNGKFWTRLEYE